MQRSDRSSYTSLDFVGFHERKALVLVPKFQRRGVWKKPAQSYLIETLIKGLPVPPIYLRMAQSDDKKKIIREVVDGQQRINSVLTYMAEGYALSRNLDGSYAGKRFSELSEEHQDAIRNYSFMCEILHGVSDNDMLEIFSRLNTYSVPLNAQELRNGTYFGYFKRTAYGLAHEHLEFWRRNTIFSEQRIARMLEVELSSELMIIQIAGLQDKKKSIDRFYAEFDSQFADAARVKTRFRAVLDTIDEVVPEGLTDTEFRRPPLFYSLFCVIYHRMYGLPKQEAATTRKKLSDGEKKNLQTTLLELSDIIEAAKSDEPTPKEYTSFIVACLRQTDNIQPRQIRFDIIYGKAF